MKESPDQENTEFPKIFIAIPIAFVVCVFLLIVMPNKSEPKPAPAEKIIFVKDTCYEN